MSKAKLNEFVKETVKAHLGDKTGNKVFEESNLLQYLVTKTKSVNSSSKSRGSFANLYALYVLIEDYIQKGYVENNSYQEYDGMMFSDAFKRQRELPFGEKLQNHALNNRCNDEFRKYFNTVTSEVPIIRNLETKRYWINENLLKVDNNDTIINIAEIVIDVIDKYVDLKLEGFQEFFNNLEELRETYETDTQKAKNFILGFLNPEIDARIFEIVSYSILKYYYIMQSVYFGSSQDSIKEYPLSLYKTGRTNANDGGIDFIMIPTGRIFQVTEVLDFKKYFLDIRKLNKYPITFVIKQKYTPEESRKIIENAAKEDFSDDPSVLKHYLDCFEELITIPTLTEYLDLVVANDYISDLIDELILQSKVEYNLTEDEE